MHILLTGFEPFGGQQVNPSWRAVTQVNAPFGASLVRAELPVSWGETARSVEDLIKRHQPDIILLSGQAGGSTCVRVERVGINLRDSAAPDNVGTIRRDEPIFPGAPAAYFTTYDHMAVLEALRQAAIPASLSYSAGAYLCNEALYTALYRAPNARIGFIHLPYLPEQTETAFSLPIERQVEALQLALNCLSV